MHSITKTKTCDCNCYKLDKDFYKYKYMFVCVFAHVCMTACMCSSCKWVWRGNIPFLGFIDLFIYDKKESKYKYNFHNNTIPKYFNNDFCSWILAIGIFHHFMSCLILSVNWSRASQMCQGQILIAMVLWLVLRRFLL